MKMDRSAKPEGEEMPKTDEGIYDQEQMEEMLESLLEAKKIEADPKLFAMVKDYAMSKNKMVEELFKQENKAGWPEERIGDKHDAAGSHRTPTAGQLLSAGVGRFPLLVPAVR